MKQLFLVEIGQLIKPGEIDFEPYQTYDRKHGYFDHYKYFTFNIDEAIEHLKTLHYDRMYGVIIRQGKKNDLDYSVKNIVYSLMINEEGKQISNFVTNQKKSYKKYLKA